MRLHLFHIDFSDLLLAYSEILYFHLAFWWFLLLLEFGKAGSVELRRYNCRFASFAASYRISFGIPRFLWLRRFPSLSARSRVFDHTSRLMTFRVACILEFTCLFFPKSFDCVWKFTSDLSTGRWTSDLSYVEWRFACIFIWDFSFQCQQFLLEFSNSLLLFDESAVQSIRVLAALSRPCLGLSMILIQILRQRHSHIFRRHLINRMLILRSKHCSSCSASSCPHQSHGVCNFDWFLRRQSSWLISVSMSLLKLLKVEWWAELAKFQLWRHKVSHFFAIDFLRRLKKALLWFEGDGAHIPV